MVEVRRAEGTDRCLEEEKLRAEDMKEVKQGCSEASFVFWLCAQGHRPESEVKNSLEQTSIQDVSAYQCIHLSLHPDLSPSSCC